MENRTLIIVWKWADEIETPYFYFDAKKERQIIALKDTNKDIIAEIKSIFPEKGKVYLLLHQSESKGAYKNILPPNSDRTERDRLVLDTWSEKIASISEDYIYFGRGIGEMYIGKYTPDGLLLSNSIGKSAFEDKEILKEQAFDYVWEACTKASKTGEWEKVISVCHDIDTILGKIERLETLEDVKYCYQEVISFSQSDTFTEIGDINQQKIIPIINQLFDANSQKKWQEVKFFLVNLSDILQKICPND